MRATANDLRIHSRKLLEIVSRGEEVIITYRGKPSAKLIPFTYKKTQNIEEIEEKELFGMWKDYKKVENVDDYVRKSRKGRF